MPEKRVPYRHPVSGRLLCPIRDLKECEREKCFFWRDKGELDFMYEHMRPPPEVDSNEFEKDNCLLFISALLAEPFFLAIRDLLEAAGQRPGPDLRRKRPSRKVVDIHKRQKERPRK